MFGISLAGIFWSILHKKMQITVHPVFLLIAACMVFVMLRAGIVSGFHPELTVYSAGLMLMLFLFMNMASNLNLTGVLNLLGIIIAFSILLAGYGLLQYAGILRSFNPNFSVTGSFDNPAGFASALCFTLPFAFYLIRETTGKAKYLSIAAFAVVLSGIILSGSRAAFMSCLVVAVYYLCSRFSGIRFKKWMPVAMIAVLAVSVSALYFLKKDSADGRLLIWQCTWNMAKDRILTGHGQGAFQAKYMLYQADYFEAYPDSRYAALADNVLHPFNEYLLVLSEHGLIGLCALALSGFLLVRNYRRRPDFTKFMAGLSLIAVAVFSCFSYPFKYPFT